MTPKTGFGTRVPNDARLSVASPDEVDAQPESINITLDGQSVVCARGETVWQAALRAGTEIPHLCLSTEPDFRPDGNCRACMVEIEDWPRLAPSCLIRAEPGMVVNTRSERARTARRVVLELLRADVAPTPGSAMARWCDELGVTSSPYPAANHNRAVDESHPGIRVDLNACIDCMRCVQACGEVECYDVIGMAGRGVGQTIVFDFGDPMGASSCVSCGSCAQTCPTGAIAFRVTVENAEEGAL